MMLVHEHAVVKIRDDMPMAQAALIKCGVTTGVGAVIHTARVEAGSTVAVIGCGGIGLSAINGAAIAGASRIIAVDMVASKLDFARKFGATDVDASSGDAVAEVIEMTGGGVHYSFEAIGLKALQNRRSNVAYGWHCDSYWHDSAGEMVSLHGVDFLREKKIRVHDGF